MTQERKNPSQGGDYKGGTNTQKESNPNQTREPWDPRREPQGGQMPWEQKDKDKESSPRPGMGGDTGSSMGNQEGQGQGMNQGPNQNRQGQGQMGQGQTGQNQKR